MPHDTGSRFRSRQNDVDGQPDQGGVDAAFEPAPVHKAALNARRLKVKQSRVCARINLRSILRYGVIELSWAGGLSLRVRHRVRNGTAPNPDAVGAAAGAVFLRSHQAQPTPPLFLSSANGPPSSGGTPGPARTGSCGNYAETRSHR